MSNDLSDLYPTPATESGNQPDSKAIDSSLSALYGQPAPPCETAHPGESIGSSVGADIDDVDAAALAREKARQAAAAACVGARLLFARLRRIKIPRPSVRTLAITAGILWGGIGITLLIQHWPHFAGPVVNVTTQSPATVSPVVPVTAPQPVPVVPAPVPVTAAQPAPVVVPVAPVMAQAALPPVASPAPTAVPVAHPRPVRKHKSKPKLSALDQENMRKLDAFFSQHGH